MQIKEITSEVTRSYSPVSDQCYVIPVEDSKACIHGFQKMAKVQTL